MSAQMTLSALCLFRAHPHPYVSHHMTAMLSLCSAVAHARRIHALLADPVALERKKRCFPVIPSHSAPVDRCFDLLSNPVISPWAATVLNSADGSMHRGVRPLYAPTATTSDAFKYFVCLVCDAAWQHRERQDSNLRA